MKDARMNYCVRLFNLLCGGKTVEPLETNGDLVKLRARVLALEMELRDRDERINQMKGEYAALDTARGLAVSCAGENELEKLFKKLAGSMASLMALVAMSESGQEVVTADLAQLSRDLEKELARAGMEPIGRVGEQTAFNIALHQRMSGGTVHAGSVVAVRMQGFRMGEKVLMKAMVTGREG